jgi:hypothetical protein
MVLISIRAMFGTSTFATVEAQSQQTSKSKMKV